MADIQLFDLQFQETQTTGAQFPVTVAVENNETVAPLYGAEALCSNGVFAPDGHRVIVTFRIRDGAGTVVEQVEEEVCATVEQPSNVGGETRARIEVSLDQPGDYTIEAEGYVPGAGGHASAQPKSLTVEQDSSALPGGNETADRGDDTDYNPWNSTDGDSDHDVPGTGDGSGLDLGLGLGPEAGVIGALVGVVIVLAVVGGAT